MRVLGEIVLAVMIVLVVTAIAKRLSPDHGKRHYEPLIESNRQ